MVENPSSTPRDIYQLPIDSTHLAMSKKGKPEGSLIVNLIVGSKIGDGRQRK